MIRPNFYGAVVQGKQYVEFAGKSTDAKPLGGYLTGSKFVEIDTGDIYIYDESSGGSWSKFIELG